ncbi:MAG: hypothetical protein MJ171_06945 [Clostridia bacterium]|nr:hypothetical protein [Clostridia bacterium]
MANHVGGFMEFDDNSHWILCACGAHLYRAAHSLDNMGACTVCDFVKSGASHNSPYGSSGFPFWIIIVVAVIIILIVLLVLFLKKKDKKAKKEPERKRTAEDK